MPVITLSRQFGAGGVPIGRALAERFGAEFLDREVVALVAARSGVAESEAEGYDERLPSLWQRVAAALATGSPDSVTPPLPPDVIPAGAMGERLAGLTRAVIQEAAARGNAIIVGRGGAFVVARRPGVLHVQLHGSIGSRVRRLAARVEEIPPETRPDEPSLRALCRSVDEARRRYLSREFGVDWMDVRHYDLAIDTGTVSLEDAVELIHTTARRTTGDLTGDATGALPA